MRLLLLLATTLPVLMSCNPYRVRSQFILTTVPPDDLYRCAQLELGRLGYTTVGADRASGWIRAEKHITRLLALKVAEISVTVIPDELPEPHSHLQLSDNSYAEDDADLLRATCTSPRGPSR